MLGRTARQVGRSPAHSAGSVELENVIPGRWKARRQRESELVDTLTAFRTTEALLDQGPVFRCEPQYANDDREWPYQQRENDVDQFSDRCRSPEPKRVRRPDNPRRRRKSAWRQNEIGHERKSGRAAKYDFATVVQDLFGTMETTPKQAPPKCICVKIAC